MRRLLFALMLPLAAAAETQLGLAHIGGGYSFSETDYLNEGAATARQRGVDRARSECTNPGARVFHACEVNLVRQAIERGAPSVTTDVLPHIPVDLVSYSAWDARESPAKFAEALAFVAKHKRPAPPFGEHGVYVGEFGLAESEATPHEVLQRTTDMLATARRFGCPYAIYWQLYCNEPRTRYPKTNADYHGYWLVRPDGTRSPVCGLFR